MSAGDWAWREQPLGAIGGYRPVQLRVTGVEGQVDVDLILLAAGDWPALEAGDSTVLPAQTFFHAGYWDRTRGGVVIRALDEPDAAVFYGPHMPLAPGRYRIELRTDAISGETREVGSWRIVGHEDALPVVAGDDAVWEGEITDNRPLRVEFIFSRTADILLKDVVIERLD